MKKNMLLMIAPLVFAGGLCAQTVINGGFNGQTGPIGSAGVASPWVKGCAQNTATDILENNPDIILHGTNNVLELQGKYSPSQNSSIFDMETAAQTIGPVPSGSYTVTFDARNYLQNVGNPGLLLTVELKNFPDCSWLTSQQNPLQLSQAIAIPLGTNFNSYSVTFCVPSNLNNELSILEFSATRQNSSSTYCDGVINIDNVTIASNPINYDLAYDYKIDCISGKLKVKPNTTLNSGLYDMFILYENNPNDPNNQSDVGDIAYDEIAWWGYDVDNQGWYTIPRELEHGKNYYLKRGIWGDCLEWKELRKYNIELQANQFDSNFDLSYSCNTSLERKLSVTGADQNGKNPHHMFSLYEHFPGTNTPDQLIESISWWQQSNASNYQYQRGPFEFNHSLDPNSQYYVKRGVWDGCTPWTETRRYDVTSTACDPNTICTMEVIPTANPCIMSCEFGNPHSWLKTFAINPSSTCYNAISSVEFQTVSNLTFGNISIDYTAPYTVNYCTDTDFQITAIIHFTNNTTKTITYWEQACGKVFKKLDPTEEKFEKVILEENTQNEVIEVETVKKRQ